MKAKLGVVIGLIIMIVSALFVELNFHMVAGTINNIIRAWNERSWEDKVGLVGLLGFMLGLLLAAQRLAFISISKNDKSSDSNE